MHMNFLINGNAKQLNFYRRTAAVALSHSILHLSFDAAVVAMV